MTTLERAVDVLGLDEIERKHVQFLKCGLGVGSMSVVGGPIIFFPRCLARLVVIEKQAIKLFHCKRQCGNRGDPESNKPKKIKFEIMVTE
jgi:hypothetical protein